MHKHSNRREEMRRYNSTWRGGCFHNLSALDAWWLRVRPLPTSWGCPLCTGWKWKALPGPTDQPALGENRTYQKRTSTRHYRYWFSQDVPKCPCAITTNSVIGPGHSWVPWTWTEVQHQNKETKPWFSSEQHELEFLPPQSRLPPPKLWPATSTVKDSSVSVTESASSPGASSAQVDGCVLGPSRLDDFGFGSLHPFHLLFLILLIALTDVDHHAGGGVGCCVQFVLLSWPELGDSI